MTLLMTAADDSFPPAFCAGLDFNKIQSEDLVEYILGLNYEGWLNHFLFQLPAPDTKDRALIGAVFLQTFIQANWTGPLLPDNFNDLYRESCMKSLEVDGEPVYALVRFPWLLLVARELFKIEAAEKSYTRWWLLRVLFINQRILENPSSSLAMQMERIIKEEEEMADSERVMKHSKVLIEAAIILQYNGNQELARKLLEQAACKSGFSYELTGVLGRRTKFQDFDIAQLVVKADFDDKDLKATLPDDKQPISSLPLDVQLTDDVILDRPILEASSTFTIPKVARAILLAKATYILKFYPKESSVMEKVSTLVYKVLERPEDWSITTAGLFLRSQLEASRARYIDRSILQYEALLNQIKSKQIGFKFRIRNFFCTLSPSEWELDRCQARLYAGLGGFRSAAIIFERREMWDELIACLIQLGERKQAEKLVIEMLEKRKEEPKMWCILGDLREDPSLYEKAWAVSNQRYSRAMRSLGMYYIKSDRLIDAIGCFEKALELNGLFDKIWFLLGCAAMQVEDWKKALYAFSRTISIDMENAEAWNNLATVHLHLGQNEEALRALKEAGKNEYDSWRIWENIFRVSLLLGEIMEAISAYRRVAEILEKEVKLEGLYIILEHLRLAIETHGPRHSYVTSLTRQIRELLDNVMATHLAMNADFWYSCAEYAKIIHQPADELEFLFKAYRALQALPVEHDREAFVHLVNCIKKIHSALTLIRTSNYQNEINLEERNYQLCSILDGLIQRARPSMGDTLEFLELSKL